MTCNEGNRSLQVSTPFQNTERYSSLAPQWSGYRQYERGWGCM